MEFTSAAAREHYDAVREVLAGTVVGLDFDGTLSPVVDDPESARCTRRRPARSSSSPRWSARSR